MRSKRSLEALFDIRDNILLAREFTANLTIDSFRADRKSFYAVTRCLEIVSEATRRLPTAIHGRYPELPWRKIAGVGNVYRHDYDNVVEDYVWKTVQADLEPLLAAIECEIAKLGKKK